MNFKHKQIILKTSKNLEICLPKRNQNQKAIFQKNKIKMFLLQKFCEKGGGEHN